MLDGVGGGGNDGGRDVGEAVMAVVMGLLGHGVAWICGCGGCGAKVKVVVVNCVAKMMVVMLLNVMINVMLCRGIYSILSDGVDNIEDSMMPVGDGCAV